jgi:hypothetical protein
VCNPAVHKKNMKLGMKIENRAQKVRWSAIRGEIWGKRETSVMGVK